MYKKLKMSSILWIVSYKYIHKFNKLSWNMYGNDLKSY